MGAGGLGPKPIGDLDQKGGTSSIVPGNRNVGITPHGTMGQLVHRVPVDFIGNPQLKALVVVPG